MNVRVVVAVANLEFGLAYKSAKSLLLTTSHTHNMYVCVSR
jgi:hypothetical protein